MGTLVPLPCARLYASQVMGGDLDPGFAHFLASSEGIQPMDELSGVAKRRAGKANGALMEALRGKLSVLLRTAHARGSIAPLGVRAAR